MRLGIYQQENNKYDIENRSRSSPIVKRNRSKKAKPPSNDYLGISAKEARQLMQENANFDQLKRGSSKQQGIQPIDLSEDNGSEPRDSDGIKQPFQDAQEQELKTLAPEGQDGLELYHYLANLTLDIDSEEVHKERSLFTHKNRQDMLQTKYLIVRKSDNSKRKIKLILVDHHESEGIPYRQQIEGEQEEEDK